MARFLDLTVTDVQKTIRDAVVVTLQPVNGAAEAFGFKQGQYLTFRRDFDGEELRRSYSICAGLDDGVLQVGIKRVDGGAFSTWANEELKVGDTLQAMPPMGSFHTALDPSKACHYLGFAGGSGITPVLSILRTVLRREPNSTFTLVYANKAVNTIMFREEIEDLKNTFLGRLSVIHVLEADAQEIELFTGLVSKEKCAQLFSSGWVDVENADTAFICGPEPMMLGIASALRKAGMDDSQIKFELFASAQPGRAPKRAVSADAAKAARQTSATITLDGATRSVEMSKDTTILDAALVGDLDAPFACKAGVCSTCRCRVLEGEVEMVTNHALEDYEVEKGYILSCQSFPVTDRVVVDYDQQETAMSDEMTIDSYLSQGGVLSNPSNVPPRYRAELLKLMAIFVDSELAGAAGFADVINTGPGIKERIAAAKIVMEKTDNADRVLSLMGEFGADTQRYVTHHPWTARLDRDADIGTKRGDHDMRLAVFNYPIEGWVDAVVMNLLQGLSVTVQLDELQHVSYQPLAEAFRAIRPVEAHHVELAEEGLERIAGDPQAQASAEYWWPRAASSFGADTSPRFEALKEMGLRRVPNGELRATWTEAARTALARHGLTAD